MSKDKTTTPSVEAADGVNPEVAGTEVVVAEVASTEVASTEAPATEQSHEAQLIPSGIFVAENGDSFEFAVNQFTFKGKVYTKEEALSDHADVLEHLIYVKSFILKKI